jgi:hypothetical protein
MDNLEQIKQDLLAWAGLHRGKAINEKAMPRFHEIIDQIDAPAKTNDKQPLIFQRLEAIHQQVRDFMSSHLIDNDLPYLVTAIEGRSKSNYGPTLKTKNDLIPQHILTEIDEIFRVTALSPHPRKNGMEFDVRVDGNGKLRITQESVIEGRYL